MCAMHGAKTECMPPLMHSGWSFMTRLINKGLHMWQLGHLRVSFRKLYSSCHNLTWEPVKRGPCAKGKSASAKLHQFVTSVSRAIWLLLHETIQARPEFEPSHPWDGGTWHTVALTKFVLFCYNVVSKYHRGKMIIEKHSQSLDAYNSHSNIEKAGVNKTYDRSRKVS